MDLVPEPGVTIYSFQKRRVIHNNFVLYSGMLQIVTVRKRSFGQVMFLQACVKNSVHMGEVYTPLGRHPPGQIHPPGRHPQQTATAADGKHPTGMHSCFHNVFNNTFL